MIERWHAVVERLEGVGEWLAPLGLRVFVAWQVLQADSVVAGVLGLLLLAGLFTRTAALATGAALLAAPSLLSGSSGPGQLGAPMHAEAGQNALALALLAMLLAVLLRGAGKFSLDALLAWWLGTGPVHPWPDLYAWGIVLLVLGLPLALAAPPTGLLLATAGLVLLALGRWLRT